MEIWKPVRNYEGLYEVSDLGRVKTLARVVHYNKKVPEKILLQYPNKTGYLQVHLCKDGKHRHKKVHRLVAEAFVSNWDENLNIDHLDFDKTNNRLTNLEPVTGEENIARYIRKMEER